MKRYCYVLAALLLVGCTTTSTPTGRVDKDLVKIIDGGCDRETSYGIDIGAMGFQFNFFLKAKCEITPKDED